MNATHGLLHKHQWIYTHIYLYIYLYQKLNTAFAWTMPAALFRLFIFSALSGLHTHTQTTTHTLTHTQIVTQQCTPYGLLSVSAACWIPTVRSWLCRMPGMFFWNTVPSDLFSVSYHYRYSTSEWLHKVSSVCLALSCFYIYLCFSF